MQEACKTLPFEDAGAYYCENCGVVGDYEFYEAVDKYKKEALSKRG